MELGGTHPRLPCALVRAQMLGVDRRSSTSLNGGKGSKLLELLDFILGHLDVVTAAMGLLAITFWDWEEQQSWAVPEAVLVRVCRAQATGSQQVLGKDGIKYSERALLAIRTMMAMVSRTRERDGPGGCGIHGTGSAWEEPVSVGSHSSAGLGSWRLLLGMNIWRFISFDN